MADSLKEEIADLERRLNRLVEMCSRLQEENRVLKESQTTLNMERAALLDKNEQARARIEAMISRLKAMEQH